MTDTIIATDETRVIEEKTVTEEVENVLRELAEVKPSPPKKTTPRKRASRAKSTTKREKPAKAVKEKAKETKEKTNGKVKETKAKATKTKPAKEKTSKEKADQASPKIEFKIGQLGMRHQFILYTMNRINREVTYDQLGTETGLSRAVLRRVINSQNKDSLVVNGLMVVNEYETEDGEFLPYYFQITAAGKKLVS